MENDNNCMNCIGYAFVPVQYLDKTNTPEKALEQASLFPELTMTINEYGKVCRKSRESD